MYASHDIWDRRIISPLIGTSALSVDQDYAMVVQSTYSEKMLPISLEIPSNPLKVI
jgi:hypothetical protein